MWEALHYPASGFLSCLNPLPLSVYVSDKYVFKSLPELVSHLQIWAHAVPEIWTTFANSYFPSGLHLDVVSLATSPHPSGDKGSLLGAPLTFTVSLCIAISCLLVCLSCQTVNSRQRGRVPST